MVKGTLTSIRTLKYGSGFWIYIGIHRPPVSGLHQYPFSKRSPTMRFGPVIRFQTCQKKWIKIILHNICTAINNKIWLYSYGGVLFGNYAFTKCAKSYVLRSRSRLREKNSRSRSRPKTGRLRIPACCLATTYSFLKNLTNTWPSGSNFKF